MDALEEAIAHLESLGGVDLSETITTLQLAMEDRGWRRLDYGASGVQQFSLTFVKDVALIAREYGVKNPLINRPLTLQAWYVWGQGVTIRAKNEQVNEVVQRWLDDPRNRVELTSYQAREMKEIDLSADGNLFLALTKVDDRVVVRSIPLAEITDIFYNPEDRRDPWYYKRRWTQRTLTDTGAEVLTPKEAWYRSLGHSRRAEAATTFAGLEVAEPVVYHVKVGGFGDWAYGLSEMFAAIDWAKAYKGFLEDWATITKALARYAYKVTTRGGAAGIAAAKTRLERSPATATQANTNPLPVSGSTWIGAPGNDIEPVKRSGANISADDGRRLLLMVAAATGLPESFFGDVSVGTLATAKSLDRPTELKFKARQTLWADVHRDLLTEVIRDASENGNLAGTTVDSDGYVWVEGESGPERCDLDIIFPPILEHDVTEAISAIVDAVTLKGNSNALAWPLEMISRLVLAAIGVEDVDGAIAEIFPRDENGEPIVREDQFAQFQALLTQAGATPEAGAAMSEAMRELIRVIETRIP